MQTRLRISILSPSSADSAETSKDNPHQNIYLSKGKWILPGNPNYERQDRLVAPIDFEDKFSVQWCRDKVSTANSLKRFEDKDPSLENLNNVFNKFVESGYSLFADKRIEIPRFLSLLDSLELDDFSISNDSFIENYLANKFYKNTDKMASPPKKLAKFICRTICEKESNNDFISQFHLNEIENVSFQENCLSNYNALLEKVTSISIEFNNNENVPSFQRSEELLRQNTMTITLFWEPGVLKNIESRVFSPQIGNESVENQIIKEIGIFAIDTVASTVNEVNLYGLSARLPFGDEKNNSIASRKQEETRNKRKHDDLEIEVASKVMFYSQPRHIDLHAALNFESSFVRPIGLHPVHHISFNEYPTPPMNDQLFDCELFAYYRLPNSLFVDRNEFIDKRDVQLVGVWGETDLEIPSYSTNKWGSDSLFRISPNLTANSCNDEFCFDIKFHSRYQSVDANNYYNFSIDKPEIFWACEISESKMSLALEDSQMSKLESEDLLKVFTENILFKNPLDIKNPFNMEGLFTNNTLFYHFDAVNCTDNQDNLSIPIGNLNDYQKISLSLPLIVFFSIFYIFFTIFK